MLGRSHLTHGVAVGAWLASALTYTGAAPDTALGCGAVCAGAALLPDIDHHSARITRAWGPIGAILSWLARVVGGGRHRGWTHSVFGAAVFGAITAVAVLAHPGPLRWSAPAYGLAVAAGCITHCYGDMRTTSGVPLWWYPGRPYRKTRIGRTIRTGSPTELARQGLYRAVAVASTIGAAALLGATHA